MINHVEEFRLKSFEEYHVKKNLKEYNVAIIVYTWDKSLIITADNSISSNK